ncbi:MAG: type II toxin-antitoxin system PemK/MazF family toxin [Deltaproteobacteria bacterium]|nr:type II toxin-antitoxin system PemK/MazF family toxin [Deltaproteobacteria bacterium]MBZ0220045.1 type II toxin-antitoxin system PemK/MazF family toxin [Deltaproteobacteria bacterium]
MSLPYHPPTGTIVICDFHGLVVPEMVKRRPSIVISPRLRKRDGLCTVVPLSKTEPNPIMPYHYRLHLSPALPPPYDSTPSWVKGDMLYTVSLKRLSLPHKGKDPNGKRQYDIRTLDEADLIKIKECILHALGMANLMSYS